MSTMCRKHEEILGALPYPKLFGFGNSVKELQQR
jgi:hypothetical protein